MKNYKIILATELSKEWNSGWYYKAGLEKNGHKVVSVNTDTLDDSDERMFRIIKEHRPDFLLHLKDELSVESFRKIRELTKVVQWYPDPVIPDWLPAYVSASDVFITMSEGLVREFERFNPNVYWLSQAFEPSSFQAGELTEKDMKAYSSEVTFIGNLGSKPQYLSRRKFLEAVLHNGFHLKWWGPKLPRKFATIPLILGRLGRSYGGRFVYGEEHAKISKLSKIYLGFDSMPHIRKSMSERMYIAVGCGAFYMCQYVDGIEDMLEPDKEIVTFKSEQEMLAKIKYYLENDHERAKIAKAGQKRVLEEHTYEIRTGQLIKIYEESI